MPVFLRVLSMVFAVVIQRPFLRFQPIGGKLRDTYFWIHEFMVGGLNQSVMGGLQSGNNSKRRPSKAW
jgi:hypothetical protein